MKQTHDLSELEWALEGYTPYLWLLEWTYGAGFGAQERCVDVRPVPARVPGSVQGALREAGIIPDWNVGADSRLGEWVEHRHWMYRAHLPAEWLVEGASYRLQCQGLDYIGWVYVNGLEVGSFEGTHVPHAFDLTPYLGAESNELTIIFDLSPRWLGQFGYTSRMKEWKTRFNYTWDWAPRLVQIGIWDTISLVVSDGSELGVVRVVTDAEPEAQAVGILEVSGEVSGTEPATVRVTLEAEAGVLRSEEVPAAELACGLRWTDLPVQLWWPNLQGAQPLYTVTCTLLDADGAELDRVARQVGFRHVEWRPCEGAPAEADPWLCVINGRPLFLQGVNFAPLCANYADLTREDYERRLRQYRDLGLNLFRINACQFLEREWFYELCDELGLLVWQEFPLTSSGLENWPPEDEASIEGMVRIARSFIERRRHHVSLLMWSGGNEQQGDLEGNKFGMGKPCDLSHPMLKRLAEVAAEMDPTRRFIPTSPLGPRSSANPAEFGQGKHWAVHGGAALGTLEAAREYWAADDALMRPEVYCPGAASVEIIRKYAGDFETFPANTSNPYWTRLTTWWNDWDKLVAIHGREPADLAEYVEWSQANQAVMISGEMSACKDRFPRCGGVLMWSGHDTWPLTVNTSLIDFDGNPKPSAYAVSAVWRSGVDGDA